MSCELKTNTNSEGGWKEGKAGEGLAQSEDKMGRMGTPPGAAEEHKHCNSWGPAGSAHATNPPRPRERQSRQGWDVPGGKGEGGGAGRALASSEDQGLSSPECKGQREACIGTQGGILRGRPREIYLMCSSPHWIDTLRTKTM